MTWTLCVYHLQRYISATFLGNNNKLGNRKIWAPNSNSENQIPTQTNYIHFNGPNEYFGWFLMSKLICNSWKAISIKCLRWYCEIKSLMLRSTIKSLIYYHKIPWIRIRPSTQKKKTNIFQINSDHLLIWPMF